MTETREKFADAQREFAAYVDDFAADVETKRDVNDLVDAIEVLRTEMDGTNDAFYAYSEEFTANVAHLHAEIDDRRDAIREMRDSFDAYTDTFASDVADKQDVGDLLDAIEELQLEFAAVRDAFDEYANEFDADIDRFHAGVAEQRDAFAATIETFGAFTRDFYGQGAARESIAPEEEAEATEVKVEIEEPPTEEPAEVETETVVEAEEESAAEEAGTEKETPEDMVQCLVCGEYYQAITEPHLQTHGMTIQEYREEYGEDVPLRPDDKA